MRILHHNTVDCQLIVVMQHPADPAAVNCIVWTGNNHWHERMQLVCDWQDMQEEGSSRQCTCLLSP